MEWISVEDALPRDYKNVIIYNSLNKDIGQGFYVSTSKNSEDKGWTFENISQDQCKKKITHWTFLPQQPQGV